MWEKVVSEEVFILKFCLSRYKTQEMFVVVDTKSVDIGLSALVSYEKKV